MANHYAPIRHTYYNQGKATREIAHELQVSRQRVRQAIEPPPSPTWRFWFAYHILSMGFPIQSQGTFFDGVPQRTSCDNLTTATATRRAPFTWYAIPRG